jgi:uncharacterized membrane protein
MPQSGLTMEDRALPAGGGGGGGNGGGDGGNAARWLRLGWADLWNRPVPSLLYGVIIFTISWAIAGGHFVFDLSAYLFPALAGFLIVGPILALGLYDKSWRIENGKAVDAAAMFFVRAKSTAQILFSGVLLCMLMLLWMRAAVILYALFFGLRPFLGLDQILPVMFTTIEGWALLAVGSAVGGLFAAFAFAVSVFAIPLLFDQRTDVFTAMAISMRSVWRNLGRMLPWGCVVVVLGVASLLSGFLLMIIVFPLLGHATWHAYRDTCDLSLLD